MNDLIIKVSKRSRLIDLDHSTLGIVGENLQEKLIFIFQDEFVDGMARLEYELDGEKHYVLMEKVDQSYILPVQNVLLTKEGNIDLQLVITEDKTGTPVFKSEVFTLYCKKSIEAVGEAPSSYELWIEKANRILLEASRVNIDGKKTGNETIITITQRDGNKKSFPILDGQDGQDGNGIVSIEKTSTSGLVDTYTITFTDGTTTTYTVTNGETPDLSDYVKNTDYATTSKGGVVKISPDYGSNMSAIGQLIAATRTYAQYQTGANGTIIGKATLENVITGKQLVNQSTLETSQAEQDTTTRELQAELDRYKLLENALPHTENETESDYVTLENTAKAPMTIETIPQTSQETTTGKNLLESLEQGGLSSTGAPSSSNVRLRSSNFVELSGTGNFTISGSNSQYIVQTILFTYDENKEYLGNDGTWNALPYTFSVPTGVKYIKPVIRFSDSSSIIPSDIKNPQIESGSTATSYEPYTGGIPSPNPDYPQEIHRTTGENLIKVVNVNLFDEQIEVGKINTTTGENQTSSINIRSKNFTPIKPSTNYYLYNGFLIGSPTSRILAFFYDKNYQFINSKNANNTSFESPSNAHYLKFYCNDSYGTTYRNDICLEESSTAITYVAHEETTYPISLGNKEMFNINNIADGFVYDETTDKFYFRRWNRKIELPIADMNNSENYPGWKGTDEILQLYSDVYKPNFGGQLVNYTNYYSTIASYNQGYSVNFSSSTNPLLYLSRTVWGSDHTQTYWMENYSDLVVKLAYNLKNYIDEEITDTTLISQLRAIKNALSMQGTTHVISTSSGTNLPFLIKARAVQTIERT